MDRHLIRTMRKKISKLKMIRPATPPPAPPAIAPIFDLFEATAVLIVILRGVVGGTKLVCTSKCVDVERAEVTRDEDWTHLN